MKQYTMRLDLNHQRPVVMLKNGLTALLDTGAYIPIWTDDEKILVSRLGAKLIQRDVPISGFGGSTCGNMYKVTMDIGGILYPELHIVANNELNVSFNFIISATMFIMGRKIETITLTDEECTYLETQTRARTIQAHVALDDIDVSEEVIVDTLPIKKLS